MVDSSTLGSLEERRLSLLIKRGLNDVSAVLAMQLFENLLGIDRRDQHDQRDVSGIELGTKVTHETLVKTAIAGSSTGAEEPMTDQAGPARFAAADSVKLYFAAAAPFDDDRVFYVDRVLRLEPGERLDDRFCSKDVGVSDHIEITHVRP